MSGTMDRRSLAGCIGAVALLGSVPAVAAPHPDANLIDRCEAFVQGLEEDRVADVAKTLEGQRAANTLAVQRAWGDLSPHQLVAADIAAIPATTPAGLKAKARALHAFHGGSPTLDPFSFRHVDRLLGSLLADVGRI